jgi:hypothetical protein
MSGLAEKSVVERLRERHAYDKRHYPPASPLDREAADYITRLEAENARLREALSGTLLREMVEFLEGCAPDEVISVLRVWQQMQRAALQSEQEEGA